MDKNILFPDLLCSTSQALSASECEVQASQKFQSMEIREVAEESVSSYQHNLKGKTTFNRVMLLASYGYRSSRCIMFDLIRIQHVHATVPKEFIWRRCTNQWIFFGNLQPNCTKLDEVVPTLKNQNTLKNGWKCQTNTIIFQTMDEFSKFEWKHHKWVDVKQFLSKI